MLKYTLPLNYVNAPIVERALRRSLAIVTTLMRDAYKQPAEDGRRLELLQEQQELERLLRAEFGLDEQELRSIKDGVKK